MKKSFQESLQEAASKLGPLPDQAQIVHLETGRTSNSTDSLSNLPKSDENLGAPRKRIVEVAPVDSRRRARGGR